MLIDVNFSIVFIDFDISSFLWVFVLTDSQTENVYYISADITSQSENPRKAGGKEALAKGRNTRTMLN